MMPFLSREKRFSIFKSSGVTPSNADKIPPKTWYCPRYSPTRSIAHKSATSCTTQTVSGSLAVSRQTEHGSCVSKLPQTGHFFMLSATSCKAAINGNIAVSFFFKSCKTIRRAERVPKAGSLAIIFVSFSISLPCTVKPQKLKWKF